MNIADSLMPDAVGTSLKYWTFLCVCVSVFRKRRVASVFFGPEVEGLVEVAPLLQTTHSRTHSSIIGMLGVFSLTSTLTLISCHVWLSHTGADVCGAFIFLFKLQILCFTCICYSVRFYIYINTWCLHTVDFWFCSITNYKHFKKTTSTTVSSPLQIHVACIN